MVLDKEKLEKIRNDVLYHKKSLIVYCAGAAGIAVANLLNAENIAVTCFCDNFSGKQNQTVGGYPVYSYRKCKELYGRNALWVVANFNGAVAQQISDQLLADDYLIGEAQIQVTSVFNGNYEELKMFSTISFLSRQQIILTGIAGLCSQVADVIQEICPGRELIYCPVSPNKDYGMLMADDRDGLLPEFKILTLEETQVRFPAAIFLVCYKPLYPDYKFEQCQADFQKVLNYAGVPNNRIDFDSMYVLLAKKNFFNSAKARTMKAMEKKENITSLYIEDFDKVLFQYHGHGYSGTTFLDSVIDFHANILYMDDPIICSNLLFYIWQIQHLPLYQIPDALFVLFDQHIKSYYGDAYDSVLFCNPEKFRSVFIKTLEHLQKPTDRDLFIAAHIAHFYMIDREYCSAAAPVIYIETHSNAKIVPAYLNWLRQNFSINVSVTMVRNTHIYAGSFLKGMVEDAGPGQCFKDLLYALPRVLSLGMEQGRGSGLQQQFVLRFEDLKLAPRKVLAPICEVLSIPWDDRFLECTRMGVSTGHDVSCPVCHSAAGYDLKPIYNIYEEYFSSFDRFRLDLLFRERQKAYGYPHIGSQCDMLSKELLSQLFQVPFKLESMLEFSSKQERETFRKSIYEECMYILYILEHKDKFPDQFCFEDYLKINLSEHT